MQKRHFETHYTHRIGWLRAAVLGANDGIVSTASLLVGIAAAHADRTSLLIAAIAGLVAGAMSMAAGEYVSVSSQADTEKADLEREREELANNEAFEREELKNIYIERGLDPQLAAQVSDQLMAHDALAAHARDELGMSPSHRARPIQAALASAASFAAGATLPALLVAIAPMAYILEILSLCSLLFLAILGAISASAGGANILKATLRVTFWGALAMALTALIGHLFGMAL